MERYNLSIHGNGREDSKTRVEIVLDSDGRPELLHDASGGGRFSQVIRGFVGAGKLPQAIAIKLERSEIDRVHGGSKFDTEYQVQQQVHQGGGLSERSRVVRLIQIFSSKSTRYCDELPPTLICPASKSIVAPRCPNCLDALREDLCCSKQNCFQLNTTDTSELEKIRKASSCGECLSGCSRHYWLNERTCKILLYELLDVDVQDYFDWRWGKGAAKSQTRVGWQKFNNEHMPAIQKRQQQLHRASNPGLLQEYEEWRMVLNLFNDVVMGVVELHGKSVCHLDLKPANLGLIFEGSNARLKILDLGHASHHSVPWSMLYQSKSDDLGSQRTDSPYWAPEQSHAFLQLGAISCEQLDKRFVNVVAKDPYQTTTLVPGDYIRIPNRPYLEVTSNGIHKDRKVFTKARLPASAATTPLNGSQFSALGTVEKFDNACLLRGASYNADLYAIGLILIQFVARGRFDAKLFRSEQPAIERAIRNRVSNEARMPARVVVEGLLKELSPNLASLFRQVTDSIPDVPELKGLVMELIGIGLRATCRGITGFSYVNDRGDRSQKGINALDQLRTDVSAIQDLLSILLHTQDLQFGRVFGRRVNGVQKLTAWLGKQTGYSSYEGNNYDRDVIRNTLDSLNVSDEEQCGREFRWLLSVYHGNALQLRHDVDLFRRELEAGVTITPLHPVVANMFGIMNPSENLDNLQRTDLQTRYEKWLVAQKQMQSAIDNLNKHIATLKRQSRIVWHQQEIEALERELKQLEQAQSLVAEAVSSLGGWFAEFQTSRNASITGWNRLTVSKGWHTYGSFIEKQLSTEQTQTKGWLDERMQSATLASDYSRQMRDRLVKSWQAAFNHRYDTNLGKWRKWMLSMLGIRLKATVRFDSNQVQLLEQLHQQTLQKIQTKPESPFNKYMSQTQ